MVQSRSEPIVVLQRNELSKKSSTQRECTTASLAQICTQSSSTYTMSRVPPNSVAGSRTTLLSLGTCVQQFIGVLPKCIVSVMCEEFLAQLTISTVKSTFMGHCSAQESLNVV